MARNFALLGLLFFASILAFVKPSLGSWVDPCEACRSVGGWYTGGCSGLTARLLGRPYKATHGYSQGAAIADMDDVAAGTIVGWKGRPYGHVTVYVGYGCCQCAFVDAPLQVSRGGGTSRCKHGGYGRTLYYMNY